MASRKSPTSGRLEKYRAKRSASATPEPFGTPSIDRPRLFVIQKHDATRLHYDFRLEWGGTLWSWAIPNGPSYDPKERRLAVQVEDHPVEYADFEGIIPKGNYGAGPVIVWDRGTWVPHEDPDDGLASGKLHFDLHGAKLRGEWILVRTQRGPKDWLFFKKADAYAARPGQAKPIDERSILSGLTIEELLSGTSRAEPIRARLQKLGAPRRRVDPLKVTPMLAETADKPFSGPGWIFELKYDGYRMIASRDAEGQVRLSYRSGLDATSLFPDLARTIAALPWAGVVLDGELVVLDDAGRPDFQRLQKRARLRKRTEIERGTTELPATLFLFDVLGFEDFDLRGLPLIERKAILKDLLPPAGSLRYSDHVEVRGEEMYANAVKLGLEGLMAKKADSAYQMRRSPNWQKLVADRTGDFVVVGFTAPGGARVGLGALHLATCVGGEFVYSGRVGTGFNDQQLTDFRHELEGMRIAKPPCTGNVPRGPEHFWVEPKWVAEVRYKTWTEDHLLRHPRFARLRDDKRPEECLRATLPGAPRDENGADERDVPDSDDGNGDGAAKEPRRAAASDRGTASRGKSQPAAPEADRTVRFSRPEKIFWSRERYTKGDLIEYYRAISPWLLPYLRDRPLVVTRFPDGIDGKSFYQKNAPDFVPKWLRTEPIWSEHSEREVSYFVCDDLDSLLYIANMGAIPLHIWSSRVADLQHPDWCIIDFDPKGAPFAHVVELAQLTGKLCDDIELPSFVKTTGSTGLHVLLPLGGLCTYEQSRQLANLVVRYLNEQRPDISTIARVITARRGKVYLDWLQNRHGQLIAAPFCVRPLPGAPVSMPLRWSEVNSKLDNSTFTIRTALPRMAKLKDDPFHPVLTTRPDLVGALTRLASKLRKPGAGDEEAEADTVEEAAEGIPKTVRASRSRPSRSSTSKSPAPKSPTRKSSTQKLPTRKTPSRKR